MLLLLLAKAWDLDEVARHTMLFLLSSEVAASVTDLTHHYGRERSGEARDLYLGTPGIRRGSLRGLVRASFSVNFKCI